jgi:hypothetical protein
MRRLWVLLPIALLLGCTSTPTASPAAISCQPYGYTPAPIAFSFPVGPVTAAVAEETAVALFRSCQGPSSITALTSSSKASAGMKVGPNAGQAVWLVQLDATITEPSPGSSYQSHFLIEVNQATGVPTVIGYG